MSFINLHFFCTISLYISSLIAFWGILLALIKTATQYFFLVFIISFILPPLAVSQLIPRDFSAAGDQRDPLVGGCISASAGKELGTIKDIKFKTNEYNAELDLYCFYDADPDMRFPIYVYIDRGAVVGDKVTLELLALDIDTDWQGGGGCDPEVPTVSFNGHDLVRGSAETLTGLQSGD